MCLEKKNINILFAICIILLFSIVFGITHINSLPTNNHLWAQSDWFSITIGFINNGFDFFHPETLIQNKQFPSNWASDDGTTITSANFPMVNYVVAFIMNLLDTRNPWAYRLTTLIISSIGLFFMFMMCKRITKNVYKSFLMLFFAITSPVYLYYFDGFLPSIPALALVMIGFWAYIVYYQDKKAFFWYLSVFLLTFATLIRTSQAIALLTIVCFEFWRIIFQSFESKNTFIKLFIKRIPVIFISFLTILLFLLWNSKLRNENGSLFLNNLMPPRNFGDIYNVFYSIINNHLFVYYCPLHYCIIVFLLVRIIILYLQNKKPKPNSNSLFWLLIIYIIGSISFFIALMRQFNAHDYYYLDTFYMPIIIAVTLALNKIPTSQMPIYKQFLTIFFCASLLTAFCIKPYYEKYRTDSIANTTINHFIYSDSFIDNIGISKESKILSLFSFPQNIPFIEMNRKGYSVMFYDTNLVNNALGFDYDYIVIEDSVFQKQYRNWEFVFSHLKRIDGNGMISLYTFHDTI